MEILTWIKFFPQPLLSASSPADVKLPWLATISLFCLWGLLFVAVSEEPSSSSSSAAGSGGTASASESCASMGSLLDPAGGDGVAGKADVGVVAAPTSSDNPRRDR